MGIYDRDYYKEKQEGQSCPLCKCVSSSSKKYLIAFILFVFVILYILLTK